MSNNYDEEEVPSSPSDSEMEETTVASSTPSTQTKTSDIHFYASKMFCHECGTILSFPTAAHQTTWHCVCCGTSFHIKDYSNVEFSFKTTIPRKSKIHELEEKLKEEKSSGQEFSIINEPCPKCGHDQRKFFTMQLRSADEGQTVFYECLKCGFKERVNN